MSDKEVVKPAKAVTVDEVKKQLDNLSAYVRKIVKRLEELGGIDINMDGKVGLILVGLMLLSGVVFAADTTITGFNAETGIGTFKVVSDGTDCTLTVDKLVVSDAVTAPNGVSGSSTVATNISASAYATNIVNAGIVVTNMTVAYTTNIITYLDATTNAVASTNIIPAYTLQTAAITLQTATPTAMQAAFRFAGGICTNKP